MIITTYQLPVYEKTLHGSVALLPLSNIQKIIASFLARIIFLVNQCRAEIFLANPITVRLTLIIKTQNYAI
jgi:hypothetical protein